METARKNHHKKPPTRYEQRRRRLEAAGAERVTTWRGRPCIGGGCAGHAEPIKTAWDAPLPFKRQPARRAKGGAK